MVRSFLLASLLTGTTLIVASPAFADVKAGVDAWAAGNYPGAIAEWKGPAENGDPDALFNLGQAYKLGRGVPQDLAKAEELFGKAAVKGHMQASDNYGLLLFQRGEKAKAMPYIAAAAGRGDARAQYLLGLAHFNGENVPKDWVRAYALVSLAQQAGLPQAVSALSQMDAHIPIGQRQQSVRLATQLAADAAATRARQLAAADLGPTVASTGAPGLSSMGVPSLAGKAPRVAAVVPSDENAPKTGPQSPIGKVPPVADMLDSAHRSAVAAPRPIAPPSPKPRPATVKPAPPPTVRATGGAWRVQLGAFGVPSNADALWNRVRNRPELAGAGKLLVPAGRLQKLQASGFAGQSDAQAACRKLSAAGFTCLPVRN